MAVEAWAVEEKGSLLVDTVRFLAGDAKNAAIRLRKSQVKWAELERAGFRLVRVYVQVSNRLPEKPKTPKKQLIESARSLIGSRADEVPIRRS